MSEIILIVQGLLIILFVGFGMYFKNYLQQKGKNLATKEDIAKITDEIENVKTTYKQRYDLSIAERGFYDEMIKNIEGFLAEIKKCELEMGKGKNSLTKEMIMQDEQLRPKYLNFIDSANVIIAKAFVFLGEESYTNFKNAIEKQPDFAHIRINLLDAMRKSVHPETKLKANEDSRNLNY